MEIVLHKSLADISPEVWDGLVAASPSGSIFHSYGWHNAVIRSYGYRAELFILGIYESGVCVGIVPLRIERKGSLRVLRFIGDVRADYCDFIYAANQVNIARATGDWLAQTRDSWDELQLDNIPADSQTWVGIKHLVADHHWQILNLPVMPCPTMVLAGHSEFVAGVLNKKSLKRHLKHFMSKEGFTVRHISDPLEIGGLLNKFFTQHIHRWSMRGEPSLFADRSNRDFYRALLNETALAGRILLSEVSSEGATVAFHFGFLDRARLLWYKPSFEVQLARYYPGEVLLRELVIYARDQGLAELDFTRGGEQFKSRFANHTRYNRSCIITRDVVRHGRLRLKQVVKESPIIRRCFSFALDVKELIFVLLYKKRVVNEYRSGVGKEEDHRQYYSSSRVVRQYCSDYALQKPEAVVLDMLRPELPGMRVLDIGMGAGRTSLYFATIACEYCAFDLAPDMVRVCQERLGDLMAPEMFREGDFRRMNFLADSSFDFILISFNAIDYVKEAERQFIFTDVKRIASEGAWLCFSSHNMQSVTVQGAKGPGDFLRRVARFMLLAEANSGLPALVSRSGSMILDASGDYQLPTYYITPGAQVDQLLRLGFKEVKVLSVLTGQEVKGAANWAKMRESWVYYLCRV